MPSQSAKVEHFSNLFHLGYRLPQEQPLLTALFHAVRYVILCGSPNRAKNIASRLSPNCTDDLCRTDRYLLLRPIPEAIVAAHGIGLGSIDVLLHEIYNALDAAGATDWCFIRVGSCGGIGVAPGTLVFTRRPVNGAFEPALRMYVLGEDVRFPAVLDDRLSESLFKSGINRFGDICIRGDTLCAETFHVAQGRQDGAFTEYLEEDRTAYVKKCHDAGVINIEMESLPLAAFATRMSVPAAVVCTVLVDRLLQETPTSPEKDLALYQSRAVQVVADFVLARLRDEGSQAD